MCLNPEKVTEIARGCSSWKEFRERSRAAYFYAWKHGMLGMFPWLKRLQRPHGTLSFEHCRETAATCGTTVEFRKRFRSEYCTATRRGWLPLFPWLRKENRHWTVETVTEEARRYSYLADFRNSNRSAYNYAWRNDMIERFTWLARHRKQNCKHQDTKG